MSTNNVDTVRLAISSLRSPEEERADITVGFSTTNKFLSRVIRFFTVGSVSHSWIAHNSEDYRQRMVLQAEAWSFETRPWKRWLRENKWIAEYKYSGLYQIPSLQNTAKSLGLKYDWENGILAGLLAWFRRWWGMKFSVRLRNTPGRVWCAEAVVRFLKEAGCDCVKNLDPETVVPSELYDIVRTSPEFIAVRRREE